MDSKNESFEVEFTEECVEEMTEIYEYISNNLYVILYTIDFEKRKVYISRMIYGRRNYLNLY